MVIVLCNLCHSLLYHKYISEITGFLQFLVFDNLIPIQRIKYFYTKLGRNVQCLSCFIIIIYPNFRESRFPRELKTPSLIAYLYDNVQNKLTPQYAGFIFLIILCNSLNRTFKAVLFDYFHIVQPSNTTE